MNPDLQGTNMFAVTPNNSTDITGADQRGFYIYVGGAGNLTVDTLGGQTSVEVVGCPAGFILPVKVVRVRTATTATSLLAIN